MNTPTVRLFQGRRSADPAAEIDARLATVRQRIISACTRAGRSPESVRLLPVSKTTPAEVLRAEVTAGLTCFGENKVQGARFKTQALAGLPVAWSMAHMPDFTALNARGLMTLAVFSADASAVRRCFRLLRARRRRSC